jgi:hypothetical protein
MKNLTRLLTCFSAFAATTAFAEGVKDCDGALILSTYSRTDKQFSDWRLAENVDSGSWNTATRNGALNIPIYGVMAGASYNDYKQNINTLKRNNTQSYQTDTFRNVLWTGLDETSAKAYAACLANSTKKNLALIPRTATTTDVSFDLQYTIVGRGRNPISIKWSGAAAKKNTFPKNVYAGNTPIIVRRPQTDGTLTVSGDGLSDSIVITPLPATPPPSSLYLNECKIETTPQPLFQLPAGSSFTWTCPNLQGGSYDAVISIKPTSLTGAGVRVGYSLTVATSGTKGQNFNVTTNGQMDINMPGSGLPDVFSGSKSIIVNDGEFARITLGVHAVADQCCWGSGNQANGTVVLPPVVSISLKRAG